ncbi:MAG TPA: M67 family metallopeptidase [Thermomicrobiaceae bacterium]|nr:M67 family metallopeptidase [Thermomicrobiaceae bacterium]
MTAVETVFLVLPEDVHTAIVGHGEASYPDECCGILLGAADGAARRVERALPIENRWEAAERGNRFLIGPEDVLRAERTARREGLDVLGFYHSHPDDVARPSGFDRDHAWPWYTYLIASVRAGRCVDLAGWELRADRSGYDAVRIRQERAVDRAAAAELREGIR